MPNVNGKEFPYTSEGKAQAKVYAKETGGTMAYKPFKMRGNPMKRNFGIGASPAKQGMAAAATPDPLTTMGVGQTAVATTPGITPLPREGVVDPDVAAARPTERTHAGIIQKKGSPAKQSGDIHRYGTSARTKKPATSHMGGGFTKSGSPVKQFIPLSERTDLTEKEKQKIDELKKNLKPGQFIGPDIKVYGHGGKKEKEDSPGDKTGSPAKLFGEMKKYRARASNIDRLTAKTERKLTKAEIALAEGKYRKAGRKYGKAWTKAAKIEKLKRRAGAVTPVAPVTADADTDTTGSLTTGTRAQKSAARAAYKGKESLPGYKKSFTPEVEAKYKDKGGFDQYVKDAKAYWKKKEEERNQ